MVEQSERSGPSGDARARLRWAGLRATSARLAVLKALAGGPVRYEVRLGDIHHHHVCRRCGAVADVPGAAGDTPCLTAADGAGYEIDAAEAIFWGRCPACVASRAVSSGGRKRTSSVRHRLSDSALDPQQPRSRAMSHLKESAREEQDRRV